MSPDDRVARLRAVYDDLCSDLDDAQLLEAFCGPYEPHEEFWPPDDDRTPGATA